MDAMINYDNYNNNYHKKVNGITKNSKWSRLKEVGMSHFNGDNLYTSTNI